MNWIPVLLLLCGYCEGSSVTSIKQNRTRRTVHAVWKPAARKAYHLCGPDLRDHESCKLPQWCPEGGGTCCLGECICPTRFHPCAPPQERSTAPSTLTTKEDGHCMLECMLKCYKPCDDGTETSDKCKNKCSAACLVKCARR
uniref:TIL domain containing protein n=1 Tax=Rhipicephalus appendiculatus TaxID=34631 RepID=A0A131Z098_RHIAP